MNSILELRYEELNVKKIIALCTYAAAKRKPKNCRVVPDSNSDLGDTNGEPTVLVS